MPRVKAVRRRRNGTIARVKLTTGEELTINQAFTRAKSGQIDNVQAVHREDGKKYIRSNPDGDTKNNLENLPEF